MNRIERSVSLHPYFKVRPGNMNAVMALLREFAAKTTTEAQVLYYEFTLHGDEVFCREAYTGAEGVQAHLANVGALLERFMGLADLTRFEVHGPAEELEKLKGPLGALQPAWFVYECGISAQ